MDEAKKDLRKQKTKKSGDKKQRIAIGIFVVGMIMLVVGAAFLIVKLTAKPAVADGDYLVSAKEWTLTNGNCPEGEELPECEKTSVIWDFTEIGKGTLTTNNHHNDYEFVWVLKDGRLTINTKWLYELENEYEYELNQGNGTLTLKDGDKTYEFVASFEN